MEVKSVKPRWVRGKVRCQKSAGRCGANHMWKWKCRKLLRSRPLLGLDMSKKGTPLWPESHLEVKMYKTTSGPNHFWEFTCRTSACRCGAKHMWKSKCTKHLTSGPLLAVHIYKKMHAVEARSSCGSENVKNTRVRTTFWRFDCHSISQQCTLLRREAHLEIKRVKNSSFEPIFMCQLSNLGSPLLTRLHPLARSVKHS